MKKDKQQPTGYLQFLEWVKESGGVFIEKSARNFLKQSERENNREPGK